jgi:6-phosphogluconolactonase (cycloisomerase 2 family)
VYFLNDPDANMTADALNFNNSGSFSQIPGFVGPTLDQSQSKYARDGGLGIVNKKYLYIPYSDGNLFGFSIDPTSGALTALSGTPIALGLPANTVSPLALDPAGKFIFVGDSAGIYAFSVNQTTGALTPVFGSPFAISGLQPTSLTTDGLGKYLYATDGVQISQFSYSSTGALTSLGTLTSPMNLLVSEPSGKYMLGSTVEIGQNGTLDNNVYAFTISSTATPGSLTAVTASGFPTGEPVCWMAVTPNGKYLYTFNQNLQNQTQPMEEAIQGFTLASLPASLTPITGSPFTTFDSKFGLIDQSGNYMVVNGEESNAPVAGTFPIVIGSDGTLSSTFSSTLSAGSIGITDEP